MCLVRGCLLRYLVLECVKGVCRQPATYCVNADSRWVGTQVHKCTTVHEYTSTLQCTTKHKNTNTQVHEYTKTQAHKCTNTLVHMCTCAQVHSSTLGNDEDPQDHMFNVLKFDQHLNFEEVRAKCVFRLSRL